MNPGEFRHRTTLNIKNYSQASDYGDLENNVTTSINRFAKVKWLAGEERIDDGVLNLVKNVELHYRYSSLTKVLNHLDSITIQSDIFYISSIEFKGLGNQQIVVFKAHTAEN